MNLLGINFYKGTYADCLEVLKKSRDKATLVVTPNPEMLYEASQDAVLLSILQGADYALPDGAGIFVAYQIRGSTLPKFLKFLLLPYWCFQAIIHNGTFAEKYGERITGSRLTKDLLSLAQEQQIPVTIIDPLVHGDSEGDKAKKASQECIKEKLEEKYPGLKCSVIVGDSCDCIATEFTELTEFNRLNGYNTSIIFVTHGNGKQEKLLRDVVKKYPNCGLAIGVGGSIDLITGFRSPAPEFFQRFGGEWLYRLMKNPAKHWKRMKKVMGFLISL